MRSILKRPYVGGVTREEFVALLTNTLGVMMLRGYAKRSAESEVTRELFVSRIPSWFSVSQYEHLRFLDEITQFSWAEKFIYFLDSRYPNWPPSILLEQYLSPIKIGRLAIELESVARVPKAAWRANFKLIDTTISRLADSRLADPEIDLGCFTNDLETMLTFLKRIPFI